jgi:hypothetical protein
MKLSNIRLPLTLLLGVMPFLCGHATAESPPPTVTIEIHGQGDVWSMSGSRNCLLEGNETSQECEINETAGTGDIYLAQARTGWRLDSWECPNNTPGEPCCEVPGGTGDVTIIATFEPEDAGVLDPPSDCAWTGPYVKQHDRHNVAYPDTGAAIGRSPTSCLRKLKKLCWKENFLIPDICLFTRTEGPSHMTT